MAGFRLIIHRITHQIVPGRTGIDQLLAQVGVEDFLANIGAVRTPLGTGADFLMDIVDGLETDAAALSQKGMEGELGVAEP